MKLSAHPEEPESCRQLRIQNPSNEETPKSNCSNDRYKNPFIETFEVFQLL